MTPILLHPQDSVAVAQQAVAAGQTIAVGDGHITAQQDIPAGHKIAVRPVAAGQAVRKYGQTIGVASQPIAPGQHVHTHNVAMVSSQAQHHFGADYQPTQVATQPLTFQGYGRADGRVGTRNYIGLISSVNCSATVCRHVAQAFDEAALQAFPNVDGVVAITHGQGCGMAGSGESLDVLQRTLRGYAEHPNFVGVIVIGLGCEVNQVSSLVQPLRQRGDGLFAALTIQDKGGTRAAIDEAKALVRAMLPLANQAQRSTVDARHLCVGLQCGGSDGYSGISANPVLGAAVDLLVQHGGTAILSETPEVYGAEHLLTSRAASPAVGQALVDRIHWWEDYARQHGGDMDNNPSPGNKAGGITTILEKSLGAVAKAGSTGLMAVYPYAAPVQAQGLVFMDTPGYDPVSATGQVAGGANLICFTTGRGSTYGCKPTPSLKLATNTPLFERMRLDMDFNAGTIITGEQTIAQAAHDLLQLMLDTASGHKTCSELHGLGDNEFVPWQLGAVM
ncbi:altronate dehydratase [Curvibacter sp. CHRR-16]|uniref:UxaA family hydrolase n=1 Tax=Curvibacter sp. CHRR-16 TaxID=2835872 RepID=UPI001BD9D76E|nr:altronate dehydratase family protein [Curvibacter sp. CHRR-16]MBT0569472.1 altronate dehydratase [Curvibacter sp. CHRR-16]